jgi:hypothetical protein
LPFFGPFHFSWGGFFLTKSTLIPCSLPCVQYRSWESCWILNMTFQLLPKNLQSSATSLKKGAIFWRILYLEWKISEFLRKISFKYMFIEVEEHIEYKLLKILSKQTHHPVPRFKSWTWPKISLIKKDI